MSDSMIPLYEDYTDDFYIDMYRSLARLRLGSAEQADTKRLFRFFLIDELLARRANADDAVASNADRSAALLLLLKAEKRPLPHVRLNALQDVFDAALLRVLKGAPDAADFVDLQRAAYEAETEYRDALEKVLRTERRRIDAEIANWSLNTSPRHPYSVIAADCAKARIAASQLMLETSLKPYPSLERFLVKAYLSTKNITFVRGGQDFMVLVIAAAWTAIKAEKAALEGRGIAFSDLEPIGVSELFCGVASAARLLAKADADDYGYAEQLIRESSAKVLDEIVACAKDYNDPVPEEAR